MIGYSLFQRCKPSSFQNYNKLNSVPMVCSFGNGRMAVMTRLLAAGSFSRTIAEEIGHQKLASEFICRELRDADEANLIDEEDMHVFGLKPMVDPLNLVCCNNCKKPIKASQYIIHAELCRSLCSRQGTAVDLDGGLGRRKQSRKEKKKLLTADAHISAVDKERSDSIDTDYSAVSVLPINDQFRSVKLTKRNSTCDVAPIIDGSGACPSVADHSACLTFPSTKRFKITGDGLLLASDLEPSSAHTKIKNVPFPLASKIYYSQRNNRLRSAIGYLYWEAVASGKEIGNVVDHQRTKDDINQFHNFSQESSSVDQMDDIPGQKMGSQSLISAWKPDHNLAQSLDKFSVTSGKCLSTSGASSSKFVAGNVAWPEVAPVELTNKKHLPRSYYFEGYSGKPLGTNQQPSGSVPVV